LDVNGLSRDPNTIEAYQRDPLVHGVGTPGLTMFILSAIEYTNAHAHEFTAPLLLVHGSADTLTNPAGSRHFGSCVTCDCTVKLWEGLYHETHNEPEKEQVLAFMVRWLDAHLPHQPSRSAEAAAQAG
jgi:alpha-beta hydrolase superfamily lysophospholipase